MPRRRRLHPAQQTIHVSLALRHGALCNPRPRRNLDRGLQVVTTSTQERYSSALFLDPDFNAVVDPAHVPSCCSADRPPAFEPITCGDYIMAKYSSTYQVAPASVACERPTVVAAAS